jgi:probable rRNA maturation factor
LDLKEEKSSHVADIYNMTQTLYISSTLKKAPRIDEVLFRRIKEIILGKEYELDLMFIGQKRARTLNFKFRQKDYATDILSFPIDKTMGEIYIHPEKARKKAKEFDRTYENYLVFLFIHGLFHLKGFDHGSRMESEEARVRALFKV